MPSASAGSGQLAVGRGKRLGDPLERRLVGIDDRRAMARTGRRAAAALAEEALHDAVLEAVKGDDGEAAAGLQRALGRLEVLLELVEFGVEMNADRLEGAGRGIGLLPWRKPAARRTMAASSAVRSTAARNDGAGDRPGARLLPIVAEDPGDLGLVGRIQEFGGGLARLRLIRMSSGPSAGTRSRARRGRAASRRRRYRARWRRPGRSRAPRELDPSG